MIVGFTGTQWGMTKYQKAGLRFTLNRFAVDQFHHGDCIGADEEAHGIADSLGWKIIIHPPKNSLKRAYCLSAYITPMKEYLQRNKDIVDTCDILLAAPKKMEEELRSGTWSTIRYAKKIKKPTIILWPHE